MTKIFTAACFVAVAVTNFAQDAKNFDDWFKQHRQNDQTGKLIGIATDALNRAVSDYPEIIDPTHPMRNEFLKTWEGLVKTKDPVLVKFPDWPYLFASKLAEQYKLLPLKRRARSGGSKDSLSDVISGVAQRNAQLKRNQQEQKLVPFRELLMQWQP